MAEPCLPLVYLPGASGRSQVWNAIAGKLAGRRPPVLVDYPGLAAAEVEPPLSTIDELAEHIASTLPDRCDLAALSMGSSLALRIALAHPTRIRRLVLVAAAGGVDVLGLGGIDWREPFLERRPDAPRWFIDDTLDLTPQLSAIAIPTLLVFGDADLIAPVAVGEHMQRHLMNARLEIVAGGTHDLEEEQPDLLASLMEAHLRR